MNRTTDVVENVFCIKRTDLDRTFPRGLPQGSTDVPPLEQVLSLPHYFVSRPDAEQDPAFKQVIPYQLFSSTGRFFVYRRGGGVGEKRLSGRLSAGIGGHINSLDSSDGLRLSISDFFNALLRERNEETLCPPDIPTVFAGWINDDSDDVGRVHLGAVFLCQLQDERHFSLRHGAEDIHEEGWFSPVEIVRMADRCEYWTVLASALAADRL